MQQQMDDFQKKRAIRQRKLRRRRVIAALWTFLFSAIAVGLILCMTVFFPVKVVRANGSKVYTEMQIIKACGLTEKDNLFVFSRQKTTERLRKKLPYIDSASYKIYLPDGIKITVKDAADYLCYKQKNSYYTISKAGYVLSKSAEPSLAVPTVLGADGTFTVGKKAAFKNSKKQHIAEESMRLFTENGLSVNCLDLTDPIEIKVKVSDRFLVNLGSFTEWEGKIGHLSGMVKSIEPERTGEINLSMWNSQKKEGSFVEGNIE